MIGSNEVIIDIFRYFWFNRLRHYTGYQYRIVYVKGWRTALVDSPYGNRMTIQFMIKLWKWYI